MTATTTTVKAVNYTDEQAANLAKAYAEGKGKTTAELATMFGKTTRSIVAKLSRMGVYKKAEYVRKDGAKAEKKNETADAIGKVLGLSENDTDSLTKATRGALQAIFQALANSKPIDGND